MKEEVDLVSSLSFMDRLEQGRVWELPVEEKQSGTGKAVHNLRTTFMTRLEWGKEIPCFGKERKVIEAVKKSVENMLSFIQNECGGFKTWLIEQRKLLVSQGKWSLKEGTNSVEESIPQDINDVHKNSCKVIYGREEKNAELGERLPAYLLLICNKAIIDTLEAIGYFDYLATDDKKLKYFLPTGRTRVLANGKRQDIGRIGHVATVKRLDGAAPTVGKEGITMRFVIADAGWKDCGCDVWLGPKFIPEHSFIKDRDVKVYNEDLKKDEYIQRRTIYHSFDENQPQAKSVRHFQWTNSIVSVVFDLEKIGTIPEYTCKCTMVNGEANLGVKCDNCGEECVLRDQLDPVWNVYVFGKRYVKNENDDRSHLEDYFASSAGDNNKFPIPATYKGDPVDFIANMFGDAQYDGKDNSKLVQMSGDEIVQKFGFRLDNFTLWELMCSGYDKATGNAEFFSAPCIQQRRFTEAEENTIGAAVQAKKETEKPATKEKGGKNKKPKDKAPVVEEEEEEAPEVVDGGDNPPAKPAEDPDDLSGELDDPAEVTTEGGGSPT